MITMFMSPSLMTFPNFLGLGPHLILKREVWPLQRVGKRRVFQAFKAFQPPLAAIGWSASLAATSAASISLIHISKKPKDMDKTKTRCYNIEFCNHLHWYVSDTVLNMVVLLFSSWLATASGSDSLRSPTNLVDLVLMAWALWGFCWQYLLMRTNASESDETKSTKYYKVRYLKKKEPQHLLHSYFLNEWINWVYCWMKRLEAALFLFYPRKLS